MKLPVFTFGQQLGLTGRLCRDGGCYYVERNLAGGKDGCVSQKWMLEIGPDFEPKQVLALGQGFFSAVGQEPVPECLPPFAGRVVIVE